MVLTVTPAGIVDDVCTPALMLAVVAEEQESSSQSVHLGVFGVADLL